MVELLDYLTANGFATYIDSGGGRDFMRPISQQMYGIPRERVIGNSDDASALPAVEGGRRRVDVAARPAAQRRHAPLAGRSPASLTE